MQNQPNIVAMMVVHNEEGRWLERSLDQLSGLCRKIIILDDCSTDNTPEICQKYEKVALYFNEERMFDKDEHLLREKLWRITREFRPEWVICTDADELLDPRFEKEMGRMMKSGASSFSFRVVNFWNDEEHYRTDPRWANQDAVRFFRYRPEAKQDFFDKKLHCSSAPVYAQLSMKRSGMDLLHYGYVRKSDRGRKEKAYKTSDKLAKFHSRDWYDTINTDQPSVKKYECKQL